MKFNKSHILIFGTMLLHLGLYAQISPGDLTNSHANLEGMTNCTQCHELGEAVLNDKCLTCHTDIKNSLTTNTGFHSTSEIIDKDCVECHSEHHGRMFNMIRFDTIAFEHQTVGFELKGKHLEVNCSECHQTKYITDSENAKKKKTFMGLSQDCLSCHEDQHQGTLAVDCLQCHSMDGFDQVPNFNHQNSSFVLKGAHLEVECVSCHEKNVRDNRDFQVFKGVAFNTCVDCHDDPHQSQLPGDCASCHRESSFGSIKKKSFAHDRWTGFELKGKHQTEDCFSCHENTSEPLLVFQDHLGIETNQCASCHQDVHEPSLGNSCAECHNENGFNQLANLTEFNHDLTHFPLKGLHQEVDCKSCHKESVTVALEYDRCVSCHEDYHKGEFDLATNAYDCDSCHNINNDFTFTSYDLERHNTSDFQLEGSHLATPCFSCHLKEDSTQWSFDQDDQCASCHEDIHKGSFAVLGVTECNRCHISQDWNPVNFDHNTTRFPLDGKHVALDCAACHDESGSGSMNYKLNKTKCVDCHS